MTDTKTPQTKNPVTDRWPASEIGRKTESPRFGEPSTNPYPVSPSQINDEKPAA
jgi:hypothetical protein